MTGATFSFLFVLYTTTSIAVSFFVTAGMFLVMAVYGLATKKDLTSTGNICLTALVGTIIATLVNVFILRSGIVDLVITIVEVFIFVGLIAYDSQKIKRRVRIANNENVLCLALYSAFELYLDFINLLLNIIKLLGKRK